MAANGVPVISSVRPGVLALCLVLWAVVVAPRIAFGPKYSVDSATYVDCARSVIDGRGFMARPFTGLTHDLWEPMVLFPPGYPLLMVPLIKLGISPGMAATSVAIFSSTICVVLLGTLFLTRLPAVLAASTLAATLLMPSFILTGGMAWSEAPYLALSLVSMLCMVNWTKTNENRWFWIFAAGIVGGLAWCVRNVAVALFGASLFFLAAHLLWRPFLVVAKAIALWVLGLVTASGWLGFHNLESFGRINPYSMPPSDISVWDNVRTTIFVVVNDLFLPYKIPTILINKYAVIMFLCAVLIVLFYFIRNITYEKLAIAAEKYRVELLISSYAMLVILITIIARSRYQWGEQINSRHFVIIYWAVWFLFSTLCLNIISRFVFTKHCVRLIIAIMIMFSSFQAFKYIENIKKWNSDPRIKQRIENAYALGKIIPPNKIVLSDRTEELRILGDVHARQLLKGSSADVPITISEMRKAGAERFLWGIVIWNSERCRRGECGESARDILLYPGRFPEFRHAQGWSQPLVMRFVEPVRRNDQVPHDSLPETLFEGLR